MSQLLISKADLKRVINELREADTKPTYLNIRQALGNRGSFETIHKFKREIVDEELAAKDSPEFLKFVRAGWLVAIREGREQREEEIIDLVAAAEALAEEVKKLQGEALVNKIQAADVVTKLEEANLRLRESNDALNEARAASEGYAVRLVEANEQHRREMGTLRDEASKATEKRSAEFKQLQERAMKAAEQYRVDMGVWRDQEKKLQEQHRLEITRLREEAAKTSEKHREEISRLRDQLAGEKDRAHELDVRLARADALLEMAEKTPEPVGAAQPEDHKG